MVRTIALLFLFALPCTEGWSQDPLPPTTPNARIDEDLGGTWTGVLLQNSSPFNLASDFQLSMNLRQNGPFVQGTAYVSFDDHYVELKLSGHRMPNGSYRLVETEILRSTDISALQAEWCYKTYDLVVSYTEGGLVLTGPWSGITGSQFVCVPGGVTLHRAKSRV